MKTTTYGDFLLQLTRLTAFSCYLVREEDGFTLIDTGLSGSGQGISQVARQHNLPITRIVLTHAHADHAGSLDELRPLWPEAEVAMTARSAQFLAGELHLEPDEPQTKLRGSFVVRATQPTRTLTPGDRLGSLAVIAAPGHAPDQIAFLDQRDGTLIAGDAFQTKAGIAVAGTLRWLFPFPALATWHKPTALETARRLRALDPARLAVGHGPVLENPGPAMDRAIRAAADKLGDRAADALS